MGTSQSGSQGDSWRRRPRAGPVLGLRLHAQQVTPRLVLLECLEVCVEEGSEGQQVKENHDQLVMSV